MIEQFYLTLNVTLIDMTTRNQSGLGSNGNEGILHIPQTHHQMQLVSYLEYSEFCFSQHNWISATAFLHL